MGRPTDEQIAAKNRLWTIHIFHIVLVFIPIVLCIFSIITVIGLCITTGSSCT